MKERDERLKEAQENNFFCRFRENQKNPQQGRGAF
jgi:hypothetical protein